MIRVIEYPQVKKYISPGKFFELMNLFRDKIQYISPDKAADDCRDIKDNFLLDLAVSAEADYLITGDLDLLELNPFKNVVIIKANEFEKYL